MGVILLFYLAIHVIYFVIMLAFVRAKKVSMIFDWMIYWPGVYIDMDKYVVYQMILPTIGVKYEL